jgi:tetratricopeptide (TPR) repeat protein
LSSILSSACIVVFSGTASSSGSREHNLYTRAVNLLTVAVAVGLFVDAAGGGARDAGTLRALPHPAAKEAASPATMPLPALLARLDELHRRRDDKSAFAESQHLVQSGLARAPNDYGLLWRAARYYFWASDDPGLPKEQRSRWGKDGWDIAEHAIAINPNDVAGHYWAAVCMGNYALGLGVVKALSSGLEDKFRERLGRAAALNDGYEAGGVETAWGRFFEKLPWPKRDRKQAEEHLRRALQVNPAALRARVYLATLYLDTDRASEAKPLLDEVSTAPVGRYDAPEERRAKAIAVGLQPELASKLK